MVSGGLPRGGDTMNPQPKAGGGAGVLRGLGAKAAPLAWGSGAALRDLSQATTLQGRSLPTVKQVEPLG